MKMRSITTSDNHRKIPSILRIGNRSTSGLIPVIAKGMGLVVAMFAGNVLAQPSVNGNTISWPDDGWYQVQDAGDFTSLCQGGTSCDVPDGEYIVINHTTGERFENIVVDSSGSSGNSAACGNLPSHAELLSALQAANTSVNLTLNNEMWGTIVAADGSVCAVAHTGIDNLQSQWLASRVISAQKANTANSLSLGNTTGGANAGLALSTANLWAAVQPGGSLYGLQFSNPVDPQVAYRGDAEDFGTADDPMVGGRIGGVNVFGGGLALYSADGRRVGAIGVSGDTSCRDHFVAWEARHNLVLDYVTAGVAGSTRPDNIIFDTSNGFGHPHCLDEESESAIQPTEVRS